MMGSPSSYARRIVDDELDELLGALPAIALDGAKGVGKTATASQRARSVHRLDDPDERTVAAAQLDALLAAPAPVLIDEWQFLPPTWDKVRRAVDAGAPPGSFLLTGSASPDRPGTHSGAGRIVNVRMRPLSLAERLPGQATVSLAELLRGGRASVGGRTDVTLADYTEEILRSGFPGMRDLGGRALRTQLDGYLDRIVDREIPELGHAVRNPSALRRWMTAYAAATATTTSFERIRDAATGGQDDKPARSTVQPYRDALRRLFVLDEVPGWKPSRNRIAELALPPKHHLADPALAAQLLRATSDALLRGKSSGPAIPRDGTLLGALFESLVTLSVRVYAQAAEGRVGHLRTHRGNREVDLIVDRGDGHVVAIEVKLTSAPDDDDVRHLRWLADQLGEELLDAVVVTTGREAYRRADGIAVVPAALLGP
jgi:predicted AAA+ superfamily ATPase